MKENPEARNAEKIKHRLKAYRKKMISDVEPSALASVLSKSFPKSEFNRLIKLVAVYEKLNVCYRWLRKENQMLSMGL